MDRYPVARVAKYVAISCYFVYPSLLRPYIYIKCYSYQLTCQIVLWVGCFIKNLEKTTTDLQTTIIMNIIDTTFIIKNKYLNYLFVIDNIISICKTYIVRLV